MRIVARDGQRLGTLCNAVSLLRELNALFASTSNTVSVSAR